MNLLNKAVVAALPLVPKSIVRKFANRYIAGDKLSDAVAVTKKLNEKGIMTTMDVLGEDVFNEADAMRSMQESIDVLEVIDKNKLDANLSLKLTTLGLKINYEFCLQNLCTIFEKAKSLNIFVRIDMEDTSCTTDTINLFKQVRETNPHCGIVLQAYLKRTEKDVNELVKSKTNFRLCKGIYVEPEEIAFKTKDEINSSYLNLLKIILENKCYAGIATHDDALVKGTYKLIKEFKLGKNEYEFQMLLGVREGLRNQILKNGHRLRVYIPFGTHWYQYSIRRFKENPQVAGYVLKSIFSSK